MPSDNEFFKLADEVEDLKLQVKQIAVAQESTAPDIAPDGSELAYVIFEIETVISSGRDYGIPASVVSENIVQLLRTAYGIKRFKRNDATPTFGQQIMAWGGQAHGFNVHTGESVRIDENGVARPEKERMMKWFEYEHLPEHLKIVSIKFFELACSLCALVEPGPERTVALRKLLEAKDAAVRAKLYPGG